MNKVIEFLSRFESPEALAAECRRRGVKAVPEESCDCAVVRLVESEFPEMCCSVSVSPQNPDREVGTLELCEGGEWATYPLTEACNRFAWKFDDDDYPDLIEDDE